jgi:hypothetical protein
VITTGASPVACRATFLVEQNIKINEKREIKKIITKKKNQTILSEKNNLYSPTNLTTSKWNYMDQINLNKNQKLNKNYQIIIILDEKSNFKFKKINNNIPNSLLLSSSDKKIEIQIYPYQDRQCTTSTKNRE